MKRSLKFVLLLILTILVAATGYFIAKKISLKQNIEKSDYSCLIQPAKTKYTSLEGERVEIHFRIKNQGKAGWSSKGKNPCYLSFHLLDEEGKNIRYDNRRFPLPQKVKPAQTIDKTITVRSPLEKGNYILEFDMLREGIVWFKDYGSKTSRITLLVKEIKWPDDKYGLNLDYGKYTRFSSSLPELNKIYKLIRLTLNKNKVEFKGKTGKVFGFSAGTEYPQIWLRDAATIIPVSRYFYDTPPLCSWFEEHLVFQKENGSLEDWIDSRGKSDKNTTETDQEASAVHSAYQISKILGPKWLEKTINGEKIINSLEKALNFVLSDRFNEEYGLLKGAHTADWGDVDIVDGDKKAVYVDERTHWTVDIYDQSMFYQACLNMAEMLDLLGHKKKRAFWLEKAESIRKNTNKWLWQKDKGFYKVHLHLDSLIHDFDEEDIFAMGGNTQAILSGLADEEKSVRIIEEALKRQKSLGISTISGTLLPPYPKNFFKHPLLDDPYKYQNGAQWDWFGGRLVYAMFEHGFSSLAKEKLLEIIRKNLANRGFFEWDNREGIGQGSDFYCGSAGSLGKAVFEGYFGVKLGEGYLSIEPKLGKDSAKIHVYQPANDIFVAYDYNFDAAKNKLTLQYNSNFPGKGLLKILSPWSDQNNRGEALRKKLEVQIDGKKTIFLLETINNDEFIVIETDFKHHIAEIFLKQKLS